MCELWDMLIGRRPYTESKRGGDFASPFNPSKLFVLREARRYVHWGMAC